MSTKRPEHKAPPEIFYNEDEAKKYTQNSRMIEIQLQMSERAVELLSLPDDSPCFLLDLGCGSGLSGSVLEEQGHTWVGVDISKAMLDVAKDRDVEGDLILGDLGQGLPFRPGSFDGAVSVSALQWLCNADKTSHKPVKRLGCFFTSLYACLSRSARAVFQFYPENSDQVELVTSQAMRSGFHGGVLVDYPNSTKAKKFFLVLMTGGPQIMPKALTDANSVAELEGRQAQFVDKRNQTGHWITQVSVIKSSTVSTDNLKIEYKSSVTQIGGIQLFNIQGTVSVPPKRPGDYELFPNVGYYKFYADLKYTFDEAVSKCSLDEGHLLIINSDDEYKVIQSLYSRYPKAGTSAFVGFHDRIKEGEYITIFGEPLQSTGFVKWAPGDPNNCGGNQNCGCLVRDSFLCDVGCEERQPFFCEYDLSW